MVKPLPDTMLIFSSAFRRGGYGSAATGYSLVKYAGT